ncbi:hypothetical protein HL42_6743 [Trichophyton rubrum]|nr:hypothetical protein HL42_6743 [Trichophyton rubrum]
MIGLPTNDLQINVLQSFAMPSDHCGSSVSTTQSSQLRGGQVDQVPILSDWRSDRWVSADIYTRERFLCL